MVAEKLKTLTILVVIHRIYHLKNRNDFCTNYWYILKRSVVGTKNALTLCSLNLLLKQECPANDSRFTLGMGTDG